MLDVLEQAALRTLFLSVVVHLGLCILRVRRPQLLLIAWTVVLVASLAMPALQWTTPLRMPVLSNFPSPSLVEAPILQQQASVSQALPAATAGGFATLALAMPWLDTVYVLVAGILLLRLSVGIALSLRLVGKAAPVASQWAAHADMRISRDILAPVTVASIVLLPADVMDWPIAMREAVIAHERAHVARRDFAMLLLAQFNQAVFWFSPFSWWLHRRLSALAELASDDQAMEATGDRPGYAEVLLEMGRRSGPLRGLAMARPATLVYRIERILTHGVQTTPVSLTQQLSFALGAASLSIMAAGLDAGSASTLDVPVPRALPSSAEQRRSLMSGDIGLALSAQTGHDQSGPPPVQGSQLETRSQKSLLDKPVTWSASASTPAPVSGLEQSAVRGMTHPLVPGPAQPPARPVFRNPPVPPRTVVQRIRTDNDPALADGSPSAMALVSARPQWRNGAHGPLGSAGELAEQAAQTSASKSMGQPRADSPTPPTRIDEPHCSGTYVPKPDVPRTNNPIDLIQAKYFQASDGTPWLRLLLGERARARLTGFDVERTSVRTTVVTTLPRGAQRVAGTISGTYGSIDFKCL